MKEQFSNKELEENWFNSFDEASSVVDSTKQRRIIKGEIKADKIVGNNISVDKISVLSSMVNRLTEENAKLRNEIHNQRQRDYHEYYNEREQLKAQIETLASEKQHLIQAMKILEEKIEILQLKLDLRDTDNYGEF